MNSNTAIHIDQLEKQYGSHKVLKGISFSLSKGESLALLGRNGAGKTTIIMAMMGLISRDGGSIQVAGLDPDSESMEIRKRVGYFAEDQQMYGWMTVEQLVRFVAAFYPNWDHELARRLLAEYELQPKQKVRSLSKGQNIRLGLLLSLAQKAELLVLDDPALALDPIMRKEFNRDLVNHLQENQSSLLYSSHLLAEVEAVADRVAILHNGRIVKCADLEGIRDDVKRLIIPQTDYETVADRLDVLNFERSGNDVALVVDHTKSALNILAEWEIEPQIISLNLDEIFEACVTGDQPEDQTDLMNSRKLG